MSIKLLFCTLVLCSIVAPVFATTIGFNETGLVAGSPGTSLSTQLSTLGVVFSSSGVTNYVSNGSFVGNVASPGNFLVILNTTILSKPWGHLTIQFAEAGASNISLDVFDGNVDPSPRVLIRAFDGDVQLGDPLGLNALSAHLSIPFARSIQLEDTGADGFVIDNLSFNLLRTETEVPEPVTFILFGAGLFAIGLLKQR